MYAIELKNISKTFGTFKANDGVNFGVKQGEVHAILGENGAGKSTLMKIIYGEHAPDAGGEILLHGKPVNIKSPLHAISLGIGMVYQHFRLVQPFTILQNIILGIEPRYPFGIINYKKAREKAQKLVDTYNFNLNLDHKIEDVSVGTGQRVEILKTLYRDSQIIILDEPTAVLTPQEIQDFYKIIANLKSEGKTILVITHKLQEIKTIADRCTIIRKGKYIETVDVATTSADELAFKMVGKSVNLTVQKNPPPANKEIALTIENLKVKNSKKQYPVNDFSLNLLKGHITGLAGIDGNGQSELVEALTGLRKVESGKVTINEKEITNESPLTIYKNKLSSIPEDRQKVGLVLDFDVKDNLILQNFSEKPFSNYGVIINREITRFAEGLIKRFDIRPDNPHNLAANLSGGNQQKIILAREIANDPDVLIAFQPTRGLDVGAISYIHEELIKLRDQGKAVLLISYELDEVINLCDEIAVIHKGKIQATLGQENISTNPKIKEHIGYYMAGGSPS